MTTAVNESTYLGIAPETLRKSYGTGRVPIKLSLTPEVHAELERIGVIVRMETADGDMMVARKGGFGSAFAEFAIETVLYMFSTLPQEDRQQESQALVNSMRLMLLDKPESLRAVRENLELLLSNIPEKK